MKSVRHSRLLRYAGLMLCVLVWLANNGNPPTGRTGAPFDGHCSDSGCHDDANPNGFDGTVSIEGLPGSIEPSTTYPLTITMTPTAGTPILGGFQLVVVDNINGNCGNLTAGNAQSGTEFFGGREYLEHRGGKTFGGNPISWTFNWASPATVPGNTVKFYFIGNFTNDNNNRSGDFPKDFFVTAPFSGPPPVTAAITNWTNVLCNGGNTGSATVEADGGVPPYTYLWNNGQTTATAVNLTAGTYTATVTGSSGSGTATASTIITQPSVLNLNTSVTGTITCATPQATATATATGGTPGYEYVWSNGDTGPTASFTEAGTFTVIATDANGCTKVGSVNIQQNLTAPTAVANSNTDITCSTPQVSLSGSGSSVGPTFSYLWTTVSGNIVSGATTLTPVVNLCATYTLVVTNTANGCTSAASTVVECQIDPPDVSAANNGPITCVQQNATLSGNSTVPGVIYTWSGPNGFNSTEQEVAVNTSGIYTLTVLNPANNCSNTTTTTVLQNTAVPTDTAHVSGPITCADDSSRIFMTTNINNGVFQWIGPNGYMSNRRVDTIAVPGDYIGIVTNPINGCKSRDTITVELNTTPPGASASSNGSITCTNSTVQLTGGPTGNNSYLWTGPNGFTSNLQNTSTNAPGTYNLVVTSLANGCSSSASTNIIQNTTQPTATIVQPGNLNCNNATLQLNGTGSSQGSNFSYLWTTLDGQILSGDTSLVPVIGAPGTYRLAVTNTSNGCTATASVAVNQSQPVSIATTSTNVSCNGGSNGVAAASGSGGNGVYNYLWSNGQTTATISGLTAGSYQVVVTDGESCT
ncbi:MAG: hypothetical protein JNJ57_10835, partial [Saprospiraceae bacterium]|nr:hypothetical protein [Saprospiraceae bacterium]